MFNEFEKLYTKLESVTKEYVYSYLSQNNLLHKYIHIVLIKPTDVKYYFVRTDNINTTGNNDQITVLEGFSVEQSDLLTKPTCLTQSEYDIIPETFKGHNYNIYYESHPYIVNINYKNVNETQQHLICLNSQRVVHMYTIISTLEDVENLLYFTPVFVFVC
ncbi:MAG: hypothetical protein SOV80_01730 [Bacilli bacterium]|nr:hypothetical protein [bacterium]MDY2696926.1 hypothetical protein [Bacilli bacterium]